jgi:hypothetical protein
MSEARPVLFDLGPLGCECTDHALESIYKALANDPKAAALWLEHHDPYISAHIETVTARGLRILDDIQHAVMALVRGNWEALFGPAPGRLTKALAWARLTPAQMDDIQRRLVGKAPEELTPEDRLLAVDWIISRYLPDDVINTEAEYLAVRAQAAGRIQAALAGRDVTPAVAAGVVAAVPGEQFNLPWELSDIQSEALTFARARAGEFIADVGDRTRARLKQLIINHETAKAYGEPQASLWKLEQSMRDEFGVLNRDWRRVALTEAARDQNEGVLASLEPGRRVKRTEAYAGACPFCRKINGMVFTVVDPAKPDKDGWKEVWLGKTNVGRSASPRRREGDELVPREPEEMWWPAAGVQHPNCRGGWLPLSEPEPGADPEFSHWLAEELKKVEDEALGRGTP